MVEISQQCFAFTPQANFPAHNLNFHSRLRWWDQIQTIFWNVFYFKYQHSFSLSKLHFYSFYEKKYVNINDRIKIGKKKNISWKFKIGNAPSEIIFAHCVDWCWLCVRDCSWCDAAFSYNYEGWWFE